MDEKANILNPNPSVAVEPNPPVEAKQRPKPPAPPPPPPKKGPKKPPRNSTSQTTPVEVVLEQVISASSSKHKGENLESKQEANEARASEPSGQRYASVSTKSSERIEVPESDEEAQISRNPFSSEPAATGKKPSPPSASDSNYSNNFAQSSFNDKSIPLIRSSSAPISAHSQSIGSGGLFVKPHVFGAGQPENEIYHKSVFSEFWLVLFIVGLIIQFILLLVVAFDPMPLAAFVIVILLLVATIVCAVAARLYVKKSRMSASRNVQLRNGVCTPEDETDVVPDVAVYLLAGASVALGINFAIFTAVLAGRSNNQFFAGGFFSQDTLLQTLRFASISLLALHRILRPANRIDPMRTIMELELVSVCWDAIDGSTLYELLDSSQSYSIRLDNAIRVLMVCWYISVGLRMAIMILTHLSPTSQVSQMIVTSPLQLAPQPTVDRTLQGLRLRALVIMTMACADFYAAILRLYMWSEGLLDALQQDMAVKNIIFLITFSGAFAMYGNTINRDWNSRDIVTFPFLIQYPSRDSQLSYLRILFIVSHLTIAGILTYLLIAANSNINWLANVILDVVLCIIFYFYTYNISRKADEHDPTICLKPRKEFFSFPAYLGATLGFSLACSLFIFRIPGIYYSYPSLNNYGDDSVKNSSLFTYNNAMLLVVLMILPIAFYALYFSIGYMLFRKEFTASPGNYNSIHDPIINMVATFTMTEGALDVLSCATLMQLAANGLPSQVNNAVILFCLLEMCNACQSFALQCTLSGGHDDTPLDLVKWTAFMRVLRAVIDSGAIILRVVLWIKYNAVSSVFLVKNLYNLIHTVTQIGRYSGVKKYPKETLFAEFVTPQDWYNMSREEWRQATSDTVALQARSGRRV